MRRRATPASTLARGGAGSLDVIEIDAASHGGVDDARDLRERASFAPAASRYKVYIIDEAHMVTSAGLQRAAQDRRRAAGAREVHLRHHRAGQGHRHHPLAHAPLPVPAGAAGRAAGATWSSSASSEGVAVEPGVLPLVVRAGGGSVRDSLSVLDQLMAGRRRRGPDYERAVALLGYTHASLLDDVVEAFAAGDGAAVFRVVDRVIETGHEPRRFVEDLLERLRDLIIIDAVPDGAPTPSCAACRRTSSTGCASRPPSFGAAELSRAADLVNTGAHRDDRRHLAAAAPRAALRAGPAARRRRRRAGTAPGSTGSSGDSRAGAGVRRTGRRRRPRRPPRAGSGPPTTAEPSRARRARAETVTRARRAQTRPAAAATAAATRRRARPRSRAAIAGAERRPADGHESAPAAGRCAPPPTGVVDVEAVRRVWPDVVARLAGLRRVTWMLVRDHATVASFDGRRLVLSLRPGPLASFRSGAHAENVQHALIDVLGVEALVEVTSSERARRAGARRAPGGGTATRHDRGASAPADAAASWAGPPTTGRPGGVDRPQPGRPTGAGRVPTEPAADRRARRRCPGGADGRADDAEGASSWTRRTTRPARTTSMRPTQGWWADRWSSSCSAAG